MESAILALEDGTVLAGRSIGAPGTAVGELVFNTAMSGYQEILTDPSYSRQLVTLTCPHIGNVGINADDMESSQAVCEGLVVRHCPPVPSSWRSTQSLPEFLQRQGVVAISDVDTRHITNLLREKGAMSACIAAGDGVSSESALANARAFPGLAGMDLAQSVSVDEPYEWHGAIWRSPDEDSARPADSAALYHVVAYDFGVKQNILRMLIDRPARTVPSSSASMALSIKFYSTFFYYR